MAFAFYFVTDIDQGGRAWTPWVVARTFEEAKLKLQAQMVPMDRIRFWSQGEPRCNVCRGPWHASTGSYESETMRTCGPCERLWVKTLKGHMTRKWGGLKFYDHARVPPPADTIS